MSYPINYPTPQGANIRIFYANATTTTTYRFRQSWVKPQGASFVYFSLIGAGGAGGNAATDASAGSEGYGGGGGSGAITNLLVPAFFIPDQLQVFVGQGGEGDAGENTVVYYQQKDGSGYDLVTAAGGSVGADGIGTASTISYGAGGAGGVASSENYFSALGFFNSTSGDSGSNGAVSQTTSSTTVLQGGPGGGGDPADSPFGYSRSTTAARSGYGIFQPILNSLSTTQTSDSFSSVATVRAVKAGFGSGGGGASNFGNTVTYRGANGGDGLAVIISW